MDRDSTTQMFMEITGVSADQASAFLEATNWGLDNAVQLFFAQDQPQVGGRNAPEEMTDEVRAPIPVIADVLYDNADTDTDSVYSFRNFADDESNEDGQNRFVSRLVEMYRPPSDLLSKGNFQQVKEAATKQDRWLIVNLQSEVEFASHRLNSETWTNETLKETIRETFVFWQISDDIEEGKKVCTYYKIDSLPTILLLDPVTGQKIKAWHGYVEPELLLEKLVEFMDIGPMKSLTLKSRPCKPEEELHKTETEVIDKAVTQQIKYPELPSEPAVGPDSCRIAIRFPNGSRHARRYLKSNPVAFLWSFCCLYENETASGRRLRLVHTTPGIKKALEYDTTTTIGEADIANSLLQLEWI